MVAEKRICLGGKSSVSVHKSGFQPFTKTTVKPSSHHNEHPNKHLETPLQDRRLRKTKLTMHIPLNVASMKKYSQKEYGHLGVSHCNI